MRIGTVTFETHQGIAHLARDFHRHGLVQRATVVRHRAYKNLDGEFWGPEVRYTTDQVSSFLTGLDALLLFETDLSHDWMVSRLAKQRGIKLILCVMYEYSQFPPPVQPDLVLCPSLLDLDYYQGRYNSVFIPVPVEQTWRLRERALEFVHNAGHGQHQYAKGTVTLIEAMGHVQAPVKLIIRAQLDDRKMADLHERHKHHPRLEWEVGDLPAEQLYGRGDVFINAEQFNGLSLPLQEARAAGMMVMTTDRYPANTWLDRTPMIPVKEYVKYRIPGGSGIEFDRAVVDPEDVAECIDFWHGREIGGCSLAGRKWAEENSWAALKPRYDRAIEEVLR